ncbi:MAG: glycosyltransferase family 2 protein [Deltaproteobacteria bacterium]|nr:glycosyltransferase family 2 protein [Deltaproteobacteria bacterium]
MDLIIVNYKTTDYLHACLKSVYDSLNGVPANIHVFDNGSSDHVDQIKDAFPQVNLHKHKHNLGFSKAVNRILKNTFSPYAVLLNPDATVKNGLFESARSYMDNNPEVGIIGPKILDPDGSVQGSARAFPTILSACAGRRSLLTKLFPKNGFVCSNILSNKSDGRNPMQVDWVSGACMVVRREALEAVGGFDERFFLYWEDVDLCKRMDSQGWKVIYHPKGAIEHAVGGSSEHNLIRSVFEFHRSAYHYYMKHHDSYRQILKLLLIPALSVRFAGVLLIQSLRRMVRYFIKNIIKGRNSSKYTKREQFLNKPLAGISDVFVKRSPVDRRKGEDKRRSCNPDYIMNGGEERRRQVERRKLGERRSSWVPLSKSS